MYPVADPEKREHVLQLINVAYGAPSHTTHVPVDNPVSLDRENMMQLHDEPYEISYKADGVRYVLVLCMYRLRPLAAMVDRKGTVYELQIYAQATHFKNVSVFDGELCADVADPAAHLFLVFNALMDQGVRLCDKPYTVRLKHVASNFAADPIAKAERARFQMFVWAKSSRLHLVRKEHANAADARSFVRRVTPRYRRDGYVFTPRRRPVRPGRDELLLKHKLENPIDVLLEEDEFTGAMHVSVDHDGALIPLADAVESAVRFTPAESADFCLIHRGFKVHQELFGGRFAHVAEMMCAYVDDATLQLEYARLRPDKDGPNNVMTVRRTLGAIRDNITEREILDYLAQDPDDE